MASKNNEDNEDLEEGISEHHNKEILDALTPLYIVLSLHNLKDLEKYNKIISTFKLSYIYTKPSEYIIEVGYNVAMYLLQDVPNNSKLSVKEIEDYFHPLIFDVTCRGYASGITKNYFLLELIKSRWPDISEEIITQTIQLVFETYGEFFIEETNSQVTVLIEDSTNPETPIGGYFDLIYQDILRGKETIPYLGKDVAKIASEYL